MDPTLFIVLAIGGTGIGIAAVFGLHVQQQLMSERLKMPWYILDGWNKAMAAKHPSRRGLDSAEPDRSQERQETRES